MNRTLPTLAAATVLAGFNPAQAERPGFPIEAQMPEGIIMVTDPRPASDISGDPVITFKAPGFKTVSAFAFNEAARAYVDIAKDVPVGEDNTGSFTFNATAFPKGPVTLTLTATRGVDGKEVRDNNYLQLYNTTGVEGVHGIPENDPPAAIAHGMKLVFSDNFDEPLSIGKGPGFKYYDHKPPDGSQDFSEWENKEWGTRGYRFTSFDKPNNPFAKVDNFLRIRASTEAASTGIIASMQGDGSGFSVKAPFYIEARFTAPNAIGTWPAFWLLNDGTGHPPKSGCDEIDILEAYGGEGPSTPNFAHGYMTVVHAWDQPDEAVKEMNKAANQALRAKNQKPLKDFGVASNWHESFHTYGCLITETETIYYCDDIEMARHKTMPMSWERPHYFLVNLAIGGISGWRIDLSRAGGIVDMYIDYVRVYQGERK